MSKGVWPFKPRHLQRAIKSVQQSGLPISSVVVIPDGRIVIGCGEAPECLTEKVNEWDEIDGGNQAQTHQ